MGGGNRQIGLNGCLIVGVLPICMSLIRFARFLGLCFFLGGMFIGIVPYFAWAFFLSLVIYLVGGGWVLTYAKPDGLLCKGFLYLWPLWIILHSCLYDWGYLPYTLLLPVVFKSAGLPASIRLCVSPGLLLLIGDPSEIITSGASGTATPATTIGEAASVGTNSAISSPTTNTGGSSAVRSLVGFLQVFSPRGVGFSITCCRTLALLEQGLELSIVGLLLESLLQYLNVRLTLPII
jgi:hypothetical protein